MSKFVKKFSYARTEAIEIPGRVTLYWFRTKRNDDRPFLDLSTWQTCGPLHAPSLSQFLALHPDVPLPFGILPTDESSLTNEQRAIMLHETKRRQTKDGKEKPQVQHAWYSFGCRYFSATLPEFFRLFDAAPTEFRNFSSINLCNPTLPCSFFQDFDSKDPAHVGKEQEILDENNRCLREYYEREYPGKTLSFEHDLYFITEKTNSVSLHKRMASFAFQAPGLHHHASFMRGFFEFLVEKQKAGQLKYLPKTDVSKDGKATPGFIGVDLSIYVDSSLFRMAGNCKPFRKPSTLFHLQSAPSGPGPQYTAQDLLFFSLPYCAITDPDNLHSHEKYTKSKAWRNGLAHRQKSVLHQVASNPEKRYHWKSKVDLAQASSPSGGRRMTHTFVDGGGILAWDLTPAAMQEFVKLYARDIAANSWLTVSEKLAPDEWCRPFLDIDLVLARPPRDDAESLALVQSMAKHVQTNTGLRDACTSNELNSWKLYVSSSAWNPSKQKLGVHFVWDACVKAEAQTLHAICKVATKALCSYVPPLGLSDVFEAGQKNETTFWERYVDSKVYTASGPNLRMNRSVKRTHCTTCSADDVQSYRSCPSPACPLKFYYRLLCVVDVDGTPVFDTSTGVMSLEDELQATMLRPLQCLEPRHSHKSDEEVCGFIVPPSVLADISNSPVSSMRSVGITSKEAICLNDILTHLYSNIVSSYDGAFYDAERDRFHIWFYGSNSSAVCVTKAQHFGVLVKESILSGQWGAAILSCCKQKKDDSLLNDCVHGGATVHLKLFRDGTIRQYCTSQKVCDASISNTAALPTAMVDQLFETRVPLPNAMIDKVKKTKALYFPRSSKVFAKQYFPATDRDGILEPFNHDMLIRNYSVIRPHINSTDQAQLVCEALVHYLNNYWCSVVRIAKLLIYTKYINASTDEKSEKTAQSVAQGRREFLDTNERYQMRLITKVDATKTNAAGRSKVENDFKLATLWLSSPHHRTYGNVVFSPLAEGGALACGVRPDRPKNQDYNIWCGFAISIACANSFAEHDVSPILSHIKRIWCSDDNIRYDYVIGWMAHVLQKPWEKTATVPVVIGRQGCGKGVVISKLGDIVGRSHFLHCQSKNDLVGSFNAHLQNKILCFADEAFFAGDVETQNSVKALITEENITVNQKFMPIITTRQYINVIAASNCEAPFRIEPEQRRFVLLSASNEYAGPLTAASKVYFDKIRAVPTEAFAHFLYNYDLSTFNPRMLPPPGAFDQEAMKASLTPIEKWYEAHLSNGNFHVVLDCHTSQIYHFGQWIPKEVLFYDFQQKFRRSFDCANNTFWSKLVKIAKQTMSRRTLTERGPQQYCVCFPKLEEARQTWRIHVGHKDWTFDVGSDEAVLHAYERVEESESTQIIINGTL